MFDYNTRKWEDELDVMKKTIESDGLPTLLPGMKEEIIALDHERRIDEGDYTAENEIAFARQQVQRGANPDNCAELVPADDASHGGQIISAALALKFMLAGNAYFTLVSTTTGKRFTYRVVMPKKARTRDAGAQPWYYVSLLNGPDNTSNYTWMGTLIGDGSFKQARTKLVGMDAPSMLAFTWTLKHLRTGRFPDKLDFWHEGRCGRCGRLLTVPSSIAAGIGPECAGRV